jgi:hypothetical protein
MSSLPNWLLPAWLLVGPLLGAIFSVMFDGTRDRDPGSNPHGHRLRTGGYAAGIVSTR